LDLQEVAGGHDKDELDEANVGDEEEPPPSEAMAEEKRAGRREAVAAGDGMRTVPLRLTPFSNSVLVPSSRGTVGTSAAAAAVAAITDVA